MGSQMVWHFLYPSCLIDYAYWNLSPGCLLFRSSTSSSYSTLSPQMKNYRVRVETYDGCVTVWYEKSKAKTADKLILNRVYNQLCGLNIKEISVNPSV